MRERGRSAYATDCGAGWYPARRLATGAGACIQAVRRVTNPPQVTKPAHNFRRIPVRETMWRHWIYEEGRIGFMKKVAILFLIVAALWRLRLWALVCEAGPGATQRKPLYWWTPCIPCISPISGIAPDCV